MHKIRVTKTFSKAFGLLPNDDQIIISRKINALADGDENVDIKKLQPKESGYYRLRSGKYRVIFKYLGPEELLLEKIDNRDSVYLRF